MTNEDPASVRVRASIAIALKISGLFCVWATVLAVVQHTFVLTVRGHQISLATVWALYLVGGASAGIVAGLLLPIARTSNLGAALVGVAAALPVSFMMFASFGMKVWQASGAVITIIYALLMGAPLGVMIRSRSRARKRRQPS